MNSEQKNGKTAEELNQELLALRSEHNRLKAEHERFKLGIRIFSRAFTSIGLPKRLREYKEAADPQNPLPSPQAENLAAVLMNRAIIGTAFSLIAGFGTLSLLGFQTYYLAQHAKTLQSQAQILERQAQQQQETTDRIRRSELADKLFRSKCFPLFKENACPDARHVAADTSASLEEFIESERRRLKLDYDPDWREKKISPCAGIAFDRHGRATDRLVNLRNVQLALSAGTDNLGLSLPGKDLTCVDFTGSNLAHADLTGADLSASHLHGANLNHAKLDQVNLLDTQGIHRSNLNEASMNAVSNLYCQYNELLSKILNTKFSLREECNDASDNLILSN